MTASYVYHYNARSGMENLDGIARLEKPILCMTEYDRIKDVLAESYNMGREFFVITSLTFLHEDNQKPHDR